jgi:NAD(P)H-nitrite reductase large subunit
LPYDRPPLSKKLWSGQKKVEEIFLHDQKFYRDHGVEVTLDTVAVGLDVDTRTVTDSRGNTHVYQKLLLATGGRPKTLPLPGGDLPGVCYYRYLDDYLALREEAQPGRTALVIGGGFIGSEMAAALHGSGVAVTMVYPEAYLCARVFPAGLGEAMQDNYRQRGIIVHAGDLPAAIEREGEGWVTHTRGGERIVADLVVVGAGIVAATALAAQAGIVCNDGIVVDPYLQTSAPDIYAAGDNATFSYAALGRRTRIEHWDHAVNQGRQAGRNVAGAKETYTYMPYFFSDLFEFGYEAVGEVDPRLETFADWKKENDTGVVYYLVDGRVRGALMCNVWDQVEAARDLIRSGEPVTADRLRGRIG